jgi:hypothetical protein
MVLFVSDECVSGDIEPRFECLPARIFERSLSGLERCPDTSEDAVHPFVGALLRTCEFKEDLVGRAEQCPALLEIHVLDRHLIVMRDSRQTRRVVSVFPVPGGP